MPLCYSVRLCCALTVIYLVSRQHEIFIQLPQSTWVIEFKKHAFKQHPHSKASHPPIATSVAASARSSMCPCSHT